MLDLIIKYTNIRLVEKSQTPLTKIELRAFIGILLMLGVTKKADIDCAEIWSPNDIHHLDWAIGRLRRCHDRFQVLCSTICFYDKTNWYSFY